MKTFKIIGLIALLIVLFEFIGGFNDGWSDVDKLAPISIESADPAFDKVTATTFDVLPVWDWTRRLGGITTHPNC